MRILLTGGMGYIGSHISVVLSKLGHEIVIIDNLSNSDISTLNNLNKITSKNIIFFKLDLLSKRDLSELFQKFKFDAVIHLAGFKSVSESVEDPLKYYENNFIGTLNLINEMLLNNVNKIVFSSSASVYGNVSTSPINEKAETKPINPYAEIKLNLENFLSLYVFLGKILHVYLLDILTQLVLTQVD